jgi:hypothetical protein
MARKSGGDSLWFRQQADEALEAAADNRRSVAIELLEELVEHCRVAAAENLSEWHEIQALWLLGVEFEEAERFNDAARAYKRIVALRRAARQEAADGLPDALAAAAVCEFRAGNRRAGMKLADEVLQGDSERLSKKTLQFLKAEIGRATTSKRGPRPKSPRGA